MRRMLGTTAFAGMFVGIVGGSHAAGLARCVNVVPSAESMYSNKASWTAKWGGAKSLHSRTTEAWIR
jgi:hypothetical protein